MKYFTGDHQDGGNDTEKYQQRQSQLGPTAHPTKAPPSQADRESPDGQQPSSDARASGNFELGRRSNLQDVEERGGAGLVGR